MLKPYFTSEAYVEAATPAGTWDPPTAETEFQQALTAHPGINAAVVPNDENAAPIITYLKTLGIPANKFPITGQDATLVGIQNIISGYQCGTVYKPIYVEAQAAAALALYLRAGKSAPAGLVNGTTTDTVSKVAVKSVLLDPEWVDARPRRVHRGQGSVRPGLADLRRGLRRRLHEVRHQLNLVTGPDQSRSPRPVTITAESGGAAGLRGRPINPC